jgi:DNA-binding transcriptional LysR family regulator
MFTGTDKLRETADAIRDSTHGEVQIGVTPVLLYQVTPEAIAKLHQSKPDLKVGLKVDNSSGLIDSVLMQRLDVAVVNVYRQPDTLHVLYERVLQYVCLLPEQHLLAQSTEPVDLNMLEHLDCVAYDRTRLQSAQHDWLRLLSWPQASLSSYSNIAVASLARATGKLAIVDPYTAKTIAALGGVVTRPIAQRLTSTLCVVARGVDTLSLAARELADAVIAELELT